jgi:uroporphyrinogen decarboxylase
MNKIDRVDRVLEGKEVDYPPISLWYHFGVQHAGGEQFARITLEYFHHYDFDFLKVMNDYFYPAPEGLHGVHTRSDLERFTRVDVESAWAEQFKALRLIARELEGKARFIDTVFDPWQSLRRSLAGEAMEQLAAENPDALHRALDTVADNLIVYSRKVIELGASGIFMSVPAGREIVSRELFLTFVKPYAAKVFAAISGSAPLTVAHIHGDDLYMDDCLDFPVPVFNWWDRGPHGPSLEHVLQRTPACVMGGIDQTLLARRSPGFMTAHVAEGLTLGGDRRFLIANGCSIDTWVNPALVHAVIAAARRRA